MSKTDLRTAILKAAYCRIAPKDPEVVRDTIIVEIPIDELMEIIESHTQVVVTGTLPVPDENDLKWVNATEVSNE